MARRGVHQRGRLGNLGPSATKPSDHHDKPIALCQEEGFDAIEADNVDAYSDGNIGDFTLTMGQEKPTLTSWWR